MNGVAWWIDGDRFLGSEAIKGKVEVCDLRVLFFPRLRLGEICEVGEIQGVAHEFEPVEVVSGHGCELHTSELDVHIMFGLLDVGYVSEVTKEIVHVSIAHILL